jgi:phosphoglycolate phosphatase-like HAD superfamily hydrolase
LNALEDVIWSKMKLLIFDIDGTLTDTIGVDNECFISAFEDEFQVELTQTDWATFQNVTDAGLFQDLFESNFNKKPTLNEKETFQARFFEYLRLNLVNNPERFNEIRGAKKFIENCLQHYGIKVAFATGGWGTSAKMKLQASGIPYENLPLSCSDRFISRQEILTNAVEQSLRQHSTASFSEVIYFGDGVWDLKTTAELEIRFIGVDAKQDGKLKNLGATQVIKDFSEVESIFELLENRSR